MALDQEPQARINPKRVQGKLGPDPEIIHSKNCRGCRIIEPSILLLLPQEFFEVFRASRASFRLTFGQDQ